MSIVKLDQFAERVNSFIHASCQRLNRGVNCSSVASESFQSLAMDLFALQYDLNGPYRKLCDAQGILPENVGSWQQIPAMPAAGFKDLEVSALPAGLRNRVFLSSGTTDHRPSRHFHSPSSLAIYEASLWPWFASHLLPELNLHESRSFAQAYRGVSEDCRQNLTLPKILATLTPPPERVPQSSLVHMFGVVAQRRPWSNSTWLGRVNQADGWDVDGKNACELFEGALEKQLPVLLLGTAFSFVHLLDYMTEHEQRFQLPPGSRALETGGYKGRSRTLSKPDLHALIEEHLGIPGTQIVCEYGMSELSSQAYDRVCGTAAPLEDGSSGEADGRCFSFPPWTRVRIISPETGWEVEEGETGLIRVFDLANVYSVMAIQTEDLAVKRGEGFELIGRHKLAEPRGCSLMAR